MNPKQRKSKTKPPKSARIRRLQILNGIKPNIPVWKNGRQLGFKSDWIELELELIEIEEKLLKEVM